jgi:hypothetical protein
MRRISIAFVMLWAIPVGVLAQSNVGSSGVQPLTKESFDAARADTTPGNNTPEANNLNDLRWAPVYLRLTTVMDRIKHAPKVSSADTELFMSTYKQSKEMPFTLSFVTPYSTVFLLTQEAARKYLDPKFPSLDELNAKQVQVARGAWQFTADR